MTKQIDNLVILSTPYSISPAITADLWSRMVGYTGDELLRLKFIISKGKYDKAD